MPLLKAMADRGWWRESPPSLGESNASIPVAPAGAAFLRRLWAFGGIGMMVAVGYMDPGNWATDLAAGAQYGYALLFVILASNLMAMVLQHLAVRLGVVTGRDLAQACRDHYSRPASFALWALCELAIAACDLAEVIGSAIALQLLFGIPLVWGIAITALDVMLLLLLQRRGFRVLEAFVATLVVTIGACFAYEIWVARPDAGGILRGFAPDARILSDPAMLYVAIGILGATVMPHNLYLHSSIVQTRAYPRTPDGRRDALRLATVDSTISLGFAFFVNAAILVTAAAAFHGTENQSVADIHDAYALLTPVLGASLASTLFAVALLASGQNSTLTGTLAGQIVMEGFLDLKLPPWARRLLTRLVAIVPAIAVAVLYGEKGVGKLLVLSQVILSMQLPFAVFPLMAFTTSPAKMGDFAARGWVKWAGWGSAVLIAALNAWMLWGLLAGAVGGGAVAAEGAPAG
jgi:manganese transport protein